MQGIFALMMGGMIVFNGALIVYFLGNAYVIPQYFPKYIGLFNFGESVIFVILFSFIILVFFGNRLSRIRKKPLETRTKEPIKATYSGKINS